MSFIKKFRCRNGEEVWIENSNNDSETIIVHYKGKKYIRNKDIINKTIFPVQSTFEKRNFKKRIVKINSIVKIKYFDSNEILTVKISSIRPIHRYRRMGGSYYGNSANTVFVGDNTEISNTLCNVSIVSPLGKALLNKTIGDIVSIELPENKCQKVLVVDING